MLLIAFAFGIRISAGRNRALHVVALMMIINAVNGLVLWNFFPMHIRGAQMTFTDTMHVTFAAVGALFGVLTVGFGVASFRNWFRLYSIGTTLACDTITCFL